MRNHKLSLCIIILSLSGLMVFQIVQGQVKLPRLVSDSMVLQRDANIKIWGWAAHGEQVTINFIDKTYHTTTGKDGKWSVLLSPAKQGGPYNMEIIASNHILLKNILFGDVWVCSGQSNMDLTMDRVKYRYPDAIAKCTNNQIRQFLVPGKYDFNISQEDVKSGSWESVNPASILHFTAVGYFFARTIFEKYHIPIGLIKSCVGGSPVEAWMSEDTLKAFPEMMKLVDKFRDTIYTNHLMKEEKTLISNWYSHLHQQDKGTEPGMKPWFDPNYNDSSWQEMNLPAFWENEVLGPINGAVWFRREIDIPASMNGKPGTIWLGRIVDSDSVYINGKFIGSTGYQYPPRIYHIPSNILKTGKNIIVIRVISNNGSGGFVKDKPYELTSGKEKIDLKGNWKYKTGAISVPLPEQTFLQYKPIGLYNAMISPLLNYCIKGVLWYQGESNAAKFMEYRKLFPALIGDWRKKWNQGNFPFLYVQLPNYMEIKDQPSESNWAELREAQLQTLSVPNTGMAVAIDLGEWNDIHPLNKKDVGSRLALAAEKLAYGGNKIVASGPVYQSMKVDGNKIIITFTSTGGGLIVKGDGVLKYFAIACADKKFVWAKAKIEGNKVIVWNDQVVNPLIVRYAWADNPDGANLYNKEGLPASPFSTEK